MTAPTRVRVEGRPGPPRGSSRFVFVDVLRVALITLVIAHHAAQPYGPTGGAWPVSDPANLNWLGSFFAVNAAFFMGLLFLLAGYFVPKSHDRKGGKGFLEGRWRKVGIPLVFFAFVIHVPVAYLLTGPYASFWDFVRNSYQGGLQEVYIHLWFLGHLILYSGVYVAWRRLADRRRGRLPRTLAVPNQAVVVGFVVALALVTWVVRFWYPIDEWAPFLFVLAAEPAHLPQYVSLFAVGVLAYRGDWLRRWSKRSGMTWLAIGVAAAGGVYAARALAPATWARLIDTGGVKLGSLVWSTWEVVICVGLSIGLIVVFREVFNTASGWVAAMAATSYAAYILHLLIVVGLQMGIQGLPWPGPAKFTFVTGMGVVLAFGIGHLSRKVPGLRVVLGTRPEPAVAQRSGSVAGKRSVESRRTS